MDFASCSIATDNHREGLMPEYAPFDSATAPAPIARQRIAGRLLRQYLDLKAEAADCVLFMRVGAFYELYGEDAEQAGRILGIPVIRRGGAVARSRIPCRMGGAKRRRDEYLGQVSFGGRSLPLFAESVEDIEEFINRLLRIGVSVALAEQVESYAAARKRRAIVERKVVRTYRPGHQHAPGGDGDSAEGRDVTDGASQTIAALWAELQTLSAEYDPAVQAIFRAERKVQDPQSGHSANIGEVAASTLRLAADGELATRRDQRLRELEDAILATPTSVLADLRIKAKVLGEVCKARKLSGDYIAAAVHDLMDGAYRGTGSHDDQRDFVLTLVRDLLAPWL